MRIKMQMFSPLLALACPSRKGGMGLTHGVGGGGREWENYGGSERVRHGPVASFQIGFPNRSTRVRSCEHNTGGHEWT